MFTDVPSDFIGINSIARRVRAVLRSCQQRAERATDMPISMGSTANTKKRRTRQLSALVLGLSFAGAYSTAYALLCEPQPDCGYGGGPPISDPNAGSASCDGSSDGNDGTDTCAPPITDGSTPAVTSDLGTTGPVDPQATSPDSDSSDFGLNPNEISANNYEQDPEFGDFGNADQTIANTYISPDVSSSSWVNTDSASNWIYNSTPSPEFTSSPDYNSFGGSGDYDSGDDFDAGDPINDATGNKYAVQRDYHALGAFPLRFTRTV